MNKSIIFFILLISIFLQSCMLNAPANSRRSLLNTNLNTNNVNVPVLPANFAADEINPYWFDTAKIIGVMTVNSNTQNIYYLRGKNIHDFLSAASSTTTYNYQNTFCIKVDFNNPTYYKPLWVRAIPLAISNFTTQSVERVMRVDIPNANDNSAACGQAALVQVAYSPTNICTPASTCTGKITAQTMSLATVNAGVTTLVPLTSVDLNSAKLQIDLQSNGSSTTSLCDNTSCGAKGFDCCIEGQCVKDATQKSSAQNNMTEYNQAMTEYKANPLSFINWPNVFYICSNISHAPPPITPPTTTNPISDAQTRVKTYLGSYQCVSDVQALLGYARCSVSALTSPPVGLSQDPAYQFIKKSLARSCGCNAIDSEMALKCPDWGVRPLYSSSVQIESNIVDFYCYTPTPPSQFGPIVNLDVAVPNRTAPHRLYTTDGTNYNLITDMPKVSPAPTQEGIAFNYIDELNKMSPNNGIVNINSVLGSMSVDLNHTLPAKMVNVELGKAYILTAKSGFYTPCPKCARDTWYQNFFPFVPSRSGVGLQAIGYTTSRDTYADNTTLGNYEDTRFGRACYVPVTMLPFAHNKNNSLQVQRQNRLKTQAAYYINGYQRDWFGFNQGALIGSFDGVNWFAVGKGRRITATSTKLFLAINAAFLDLADKTDTIVNIVPDSINNIVSDYDYDTTLALNDARQNQGGTCQKYHQCSTDTDCITQLGWEYVCADVSQYTTKWPVTNTDGVEQVNKETTASLFEILASTTDTRSSFRCVYRGAGAPCKGDAPISVGTTKTVINSLNQKLFTCAPNFYCARSDGNYFNNELVRSPNEPTNFLYGFEANVLGRPLNYVTANQPLPAEVKENIKANALATIIPNTVAQSAVNDMGICRPGKSMVDPALATLAQRHGQVPDIKKRTDYISQIGNCDSTSTVPATRFMNCPVIDTDSTPGNLNYLNYKPEDATYANQAATQNSCGQESIYIHSVSGNIVTESSFKYIEAGILDKITGISYPMLAQDACLRRAGAVCNTDLDCGPNLMHEQAAATITKDAFGGTLAEQSYWSESLICSQGAPKPLTTSPDYSKYQLNQNRCCREIGKDFTMYTQGYDPLGVNIPKSGTAFSTSKFSYANPSVDGRYSRYSVSSTAKLTTAIDTSASTAKTVGTSSGTGLTSFPVISTAAAAAQPNNFQWKVFGETGKNTCCGGGFVRKFADGTHDWNKQGRLSIDTSNFKCLNYRSPLMFDPLNNFFSDLKIRQISYEYEYNYLCNSPANSADLTKQGCLQIPYPTDTNKSEFTIIHPVVYDEMQGQTPSLGVGSAQRAGDGSGVLNIGPSILPAPSGWAIDQVNTNAPFQPTYVGQYPAPGSNPVVMVNSNYIKDPKLNYGFAVYLPTYIQNSCSGGTAAFNNACVHDAIKRVIITYLDASGNQIISSPTMTPAAAGSDTAATPTDSTNVPMMSAGNTCKILADGVSPDKHIHPFTYDNMVEAARLAPSLQSKHFDTEAWCIDSSPADGTAADKFKKGQPILLVKAKNQRDFLGGGGGDAYRYDMAVLEIHFKTMEEIKGTKLAVPGNSNYYLTKLGRLELLGIPQITYEPIYCNNDQDKVVEGIFKKVIPPLAQTLINRTDFNGGNTNVHTYSYTPEKMYSSDLATDAVLPTLNSSRNTPALITAAFANIGNQEKKFVYQDQVDHPAIFSDKDFTCCTPLGQSPKTGTINGCCSGYGVNVGTKLICKLPIGTDLNVYFNRFVSNEGVGDNLTGANGALGLNDSGIEPDSDFIPQTGEPKFRDSTANKIYGLGVAYCDRGKVTNGGAFGQFAPEPGRWGATQNNPISIVDSPNDTSAGGGGGTFDRTNNRYLGKQGFDFGVRWNHHYYCSQ